MQRQTFTQKLLRQRGFLSYLLPLLALFVGLGASQTALAQASYERTQITVLSQPTAVSPTQSRTYIGTSLSGGTPFENQFLGNSAAQQTADPTTGPEFDQGANQGRLQFTASATRTVPANGNTKIVASTLLYRVYLLGTSAGNLPSYSVQTLDLGSPTNNTGTVIYSKSGLSIDLLRQPAVLGGGTYVVEAKFETVIERFIPGQPADPDFPEDFPGTPDRTETSTIIDPSNASGLGYLAKFRVLAPTVTPAGGTTTWVSTSSTDWTQAVNWSNGVPNRFSDAIIPEKNSTNTNTVTPALLDPNPTLYEVRNLTLDGTSNATRALLRIGQTTGSGTQTVATGATLNVYGDLNTFGGGILAATSGANGVANPALNSTIALKGDGPQIIRGLLEIADVRIEGKGVKGIVNSINASNTFVFAPGTTALVRTVTETRNPSTGVSTFPLNTTKTSNVNLKVSGILSGETRDAYIEGVTLADRNLFAGVNETFGGIGIEINPNRTIPGATIQITRTVGDPLSGPTAATVPTSGGVAGAKPIKRQYGVSGDVNNGTSSTVVFHYLDSDGVNASTDELNGNPEANLIIFRTTNNGIPYGIIGGTVNVDANTVTANFVTAINTVTLGDRDKPLPVTLTTFDVKRAGANALVTWETASESNSKGFNVQVSADGKEFRPLGFVASASPNSTRKQTYSFIDTEKNKTGLRYYRLQQVDLDGKTAFFEPKSVSFDGKALSGTLMAYPNPFNSSDDFHVAAQLANGGKGQLRVTDMMGRTIRQESVELASGLADVTVGGMKELKAGTYLVRLTLPSGETQNLKVVKQ